MITYLVALARRKLGRFVRSLEVFGWRENGRGVRLVQVHRDKRPKEAKSATAKLKSNLLLVSLCCSMFAAISVLRFKVNHR